MKITKENDRFTSEKEKKKECWPIKRERAGERKRTVVAWEKSGDCSKHLFAYIYVQMLRRKSNIGNWPQHAVAIGPKVMKIEMEFKKKTRNVAEKNAPEQPTSHPIRMKTEPYR